MRITFRNPYDKEITSSVAVPWLGALVFPIRTFKLVWRLRKVAQLPPERMERVAHLLADEYEARGFNVTREGTIKQEENSNG